MEDLGDVVFGFFGGVVDPAGKIGKINGNVIKNRRINVGIFYVSVLLGGVISALPVSGSFYRSRRECLLRDASLSPYPFCRMIMISDAGFQIPAVFLRRLMSPSDEKLPMITTSLL
jgi:hypothetical protein